MERQLDGVLLYSFHLQLYSRLKASLVKVKVADYRIFTEKKQSDKYVEDFLKAFKTGVQIPTTPPKIKKAVWLFLFLHVEVLSGDLHREKIVEDNLSDRTKQSSGLFIG